MSEIYLTKPNTSEKERADLIEKLDIIFQNEQMVMSKHSWENYYFPIKSIKHFIANSPTYKGEIQNYIVLFDSINECLTFRNLINCRHIHIRLANKKFVEDFPYIYEGKLEKSDKYIIPIKFK